MTYEVSPIFINDVFLQPGDFYWSDENTRIKTLLGSCIAITMWHPDLKIGGMCHYMLPEKKMENGMNPQLNGKYAEDAIILFLEEIKKSKTFPGDYQVKIFGGSNMFTAQERRVEEIGIIKRRMNEIGQKNITKGKELLLKNNFRVGIESTGGPKHRKIYFNLWNGEVWMDMKKGD